MEDPRAAIEAAKLKTKKSGDRTPFDRRLARLAIGIHELSSRLQRRARLKQLMASERPDEVFVPYAVLQSCDPADFEVWIDDRALITAFETFNLDPHNSFSWRAALHIFAEAYFALDGSPETWSPLAAAELKFAAETVVDTTDNNSNQSKFGAKSGRTQKLAAIIRQLRVRYKEQYGHLSEKTLREKLNQLEMGTLPYDTLHLAELRRKRRRGMIVKLTPMKKRKKPRVGR